MLEELRRKPRAIKQLYAFWGAAGITGAVASIWVVSLVIGLSVTDPSLTEGEENTAGAFSQFFKKIDGGAINSFKAKLDDVADSQESGVENTDNVTNTATTSTTTVQPKTKSQKPVMISTTSPKSTEN